MRTEYFFYRSVSCVRQQETEGLYRGARQRASYGVDISRVCEGVRDRRVEGSCSHAQVTGIEGVDVDPRGPDTQSEIGCMRTDIANFQGHAAAQLSLHVYGILVYTRRACFRINQAQRAADLDEAAQRVAHRGLQPGRKRICQLVGCKVAGVLRRIGVARCAKWAT